MPSKQTAKTTTMPQSNAQRDASISCHTAAHFDCSQSIEGINDTQRLCHCPCHPIEPHQLTDAVAAYGGAHALKVALKEVLNVHQRVVWEPTGKYCCQACTAAHVRYPCRTVIAIAQGLNLI